MKIALVCDFLTKFGGAQKVLLALTEIYPGAPIYCLAYDEAGTKGKFKNCNIIESSLGRLPSFLKKRTKLFVTSLPKRIEEFSFSDFDVVISSSDSYAHGIITNPATLHICYCHTPMRYVWDWYNEYLKENNLDKGLKSLVIRNILHKIRIWDRVAAYRVDKWLANSQNVQKRIEKYYHSDSEIIYPPIDVENIKPSNEKIGDYYLVVSRLEPYKKIGLAIETCNKLKKKLIIIGEGSEMAALKKIAGKSISFLGWQPDDRVYEYLQNSKALIFPGEEDFGITPVESMAAGRPVIAYRKGGVLESVIEGKTGFFFKEPTVDSLSQTIISFETQIATISQDDCVNRAQEFSKKAFQDKILSTINKSYQKHINQI